LLKIGCEVALVAEEDDTALGDWGECKLKVQQLRDITSDTNVQGGR
jgi:hypothetical protein